MRLREFFNHYKEGIRMRYYGNLLSMLSSSLQRDLALRVHGHRVSLIPAFNAKSREERSRFLAEVSARDLLVRDFDCRGFESRTASGWGLSKPQNVTVVAHPEVNRLRATSGVCSSPSPRSSM